MLWIVSLLAIVLSLLLVIGLHEAGHALAAYLFKVKIQKVSIGFGQALLKWQGKSGCQWVWSMWPIGGYVLLLNTRITTVSPVDYSVAFDKKPIWIRCVIFLSGAMANLIVAYLALTLMLMIGYNQRLPVIAKVVKPSLAAAAGLTSGDKILRLNGQNTASWPEANMQLLTGLGNKSVDIVVENTTGNVRHTTLDLTKWHYHGGKNALLLGIGITPELSEKYREHIPALSLLTAGCHAFTQLTQIIWFYCIMLKQLITGVLPFAILIGPLGTFSLMVHSFLQGLARFLYFITCLSIVVGIVNLLPIPSLDGGSILYALIEKIRGKPISVAMEILIQRLVMIILGVFLVQLLLNDVQNFFLSSK